MSADWTVIIGEECDPWTRRLVVQAPAPRLLIDCSQGLPEEWPRVVDGARAVVIHRAVLDRDNHARLQQLRRVLRPGTKLICCAQPLTRFHQLEPYVELYDVILPETTAVESLACHLTGVRCPTDATRAAVAVVSSLPDVGAMVSEVCQKGGYSTRLVRDWSERIHERVAVWDVPLLEEGWEQTLRFESHRRAVVALAGFLDRALVDRMKSLGAAACLDLPCAVDDLLYVLDRVSGGVLAQGAYFGDTATLTPPGPHAARRRGLRRRRTLPTQRGGSWDVSRKRVTPGQ